MSTTNLELITCDLCQRRYNRNVYNRHRKENQCLKRNQHRLPFESIKQRSIQIGDQIFSVQQQQKITDGQISNNREKRKQQILKNQEKIQRIIPSNNRRRTLEQAKQLLERRTKYQPPWIQKRSNFIKVIQAKDLSNNTVDQGPSPKKLSQRRERPPPPTTKFKNDDLPIKSNRKKTVFEGLKISIAVSDRREQNPPISQQPIFTHSPKTRTSQLSTTSKYQPNRVDQTFSHEPVNSASRLTRKAYTWTRSSKQSTNRDVISPIHIPTFCESSAGPSHDQIALPFNQNYDDDEFERYSPTPPSTPKYQQEKIEMKYVLPNVKQNFIRDEQQTMIRPNTYQKAKRSDRQQQNESEFY
jgi:hypothetical protein